MTRWLRARTVIVVVAATITVGALAGCSHTVAAVQPAAPAGATTTTPAPTQTDASDSSLSDVQNDLNSADQATTNAGGDVSDADQSSATSDSP